MKRILIIIALMLAGGKYAHAGTWGVQYHFLSNHFADRAQEDWYEDTQGVGLRYSVNSTWAAQAGVYKSEFSVRSQAFPVYYAGVDYTPIALGPVHLGGYAWLTDGYDEVRLRSNPGNSTYPTSVVYERNPGILPAIGLVARVEYKHFNYTLRVHPDLPGGVPAAIMSEVGYSF